MNSQFPRLPRPPRMASASQATTRSFQKTRSTSSSVTTPALQSATVTLNSTFESAPASAREKAHHLKNGRFAPPWPSFASPPIPKMVGFVLSMQNPETYPGIVAVRKPSFIPDREITSASIRGTWLGHACYLVEFPGGLRVLADPVFSERCSPSNFLGPKRYTPVPCQIEDIPFIDAVIISHNHYDHLDHPTIMKIYKHQPNVHFMVPLKMKSWFVESGIKPSQVTEMDWWEEATLNIAESEEKAEGNSKGGITAKFAALPSQHMGNRSPFDRGKALWASWSIESGGKKLFFAGDTGYRTVPEVPEGKDDYSSEYDHLPVCPAFKEIGEHYGPFDLGLIPIGAYNPRNLMSPVHSNTMDAVHIFRDTKCNKALAMHWGTWVLTNEPILEPPKQLKESLKRQDLPEEGVFDVIEIGESREYV